MRTIILSLAIILMCSCTIYTEKRSAALSQAVFATADSVQVARFDLADKYSKEATRLAFPPKHPIKISPIITKAQTVPSVSVEKSSKVVPQKSNLTITADQTTDILRLVIPDKFKDAQILIEGSTEWTDLLKTKEFAKQLENDNKNLSVLKDNVSKELLKQNEMNSKMVKDSNIMQKKIVEKDLAILQRDVTIVGLLIAIALGIYLRIKGIF